MPVAVRDRVEPLGIARPSSRRVTHTPSLRHQHDGRSSATSRAHSRKVRLLDVRVGVDGGGTARRGATRSRTGRRFGTGARRADPEAIASRARRTNHPGCTRARGQPCAPRPPATDRRAGPQQAARRRSAIATAASTPPSGATRTHHRRLSRWSPRRGRARVPIGTLRPRSRDAVLPRHPGTGRRSLRVRTIEASEHAVGVAREVRQHVADAPARQQRAAADLRFGQRRDRGAQPIVSESAALDVAMRGPHTGILRRRRARPALDASPG